MPRRRHFSPAALSVLVLIVASETRAAGAPASETFVANGVKIHYLVEGTGEPVVLIHGLYSSADINWRAPGAMAALAGNHRVIALDLPGHGRSDKPDTEDAYGLRMVEDVVLLLDHLKIEKAHVVGYSLGGMIAAKFIALHPDRVRSGVLGGMGWLRDGGALQKVWEQMGAREHGRTPGACVKSIGKLALSEDALKGITVPVVVLVGDRDPVRKLYVAPLQAVRKDWPVIEIEGAGHLNCIAKKEFTDEIVKWVNKNAKK